MSFVYIHQEKTRQQIQQCELGGKKRVNRVELDWTERRGHLVSKVQSMEKKNVEKR